MSGASVGTDKVFPPTTTYLCQVFDVSRAGGKPEVIEGNWVMLCISVPYLAWIM